MKKILAILTLTLLSGCDTFHGISQSTNPFSPVPDMQCVLSATKSIEGISEVGYTTEEGGRPLTWKGIEKPNIIHRFWYQYNGVKGNFFISESYNSEATFHHSYGGLNWKPPQEDIDLISPLFGKLEAQLRGKCNIQNMRIFNYCSGVKC